MRKVQLGFVFLWGVNYYMLITDARRRVNDA